MVVSVSKMTLKDAVQTLAAVIAILVTVIGGITYFSGVILAQANTEKAVASHADRLGAIERIIEQNAVDRVRIGRSENDIQAIGQKVDAVDKNVTDIRIMMERMSAQQGIQVPPPRR